MNRKKLDKIKREIAQARRSPQKARDLEGLARRLGRKEVKRGKEPVWENQDLEEVYPLAIPHHGNKDIPPGTRNNILNSLEDDVLGWEEKLSDEDEDEGNGEEEDDDTGPNEG